MNVEALEKQIARLERLAGIPPEERPVFCDCGCGELVRVPRKMDRSKGQRAGVPLRFIKGHNARVQR